MEESKRDRLTQVADFGALLSDRINWLAAAAGLTIVVLVVVSAAMRYVVGSPFSWSDEVVGFLYFLFSFAALPLAFSKRQHPRVEALTRLLRQSSQQLLVAINYVAGLAYLLVFTCQAWPYVLQTLRIGSVSLSGRLPLFPWQLAMPVLLSLLAALLSVDFAVVLREFFRIRRGQGAAKDGVQ